MKILWLICPMLLEAFFAIDWSAFFRDKWHFCFLSAVRAFYLMHSPRTESASLKTHTTHSFEISYTDDNTAVRSTYTVRISKSRAI